MRINSDVSISCLPEAKVTSSSHFKFSLPWHETEEKQQVLTVKKLISTKVWHVWVGFNKMERSIYLLVPDMHVWGRHISRTTHLIGFTLDMCIVTGQGKCIVKSGGNWDSSRMWRWRQQQRQVILKFAILQTESSFIKLWINRWTALCAAAVVQLQASVDSSRSLTRHSSITKGHFCSLRKKAATSITTGQATADSTQAGFRTDTALV